MLQLGRWKSTGFMPWMNVRPSLLTWLITCRVATALRAFLAAFFDLKHAYKQYGISSQDREVIRLEVRKSDSGQVSLFGVNSLPFGASGSVGGFLRVSLAIGFLGLSISSWYGRPSLAIRQFSLGTP